MKCVLRNKKTFVSVLFLSLLLLGVVAPSMFKIPSVNANPGSTFGKTSVGTSNGTLYATYAYGCNYTLSESTSINSISAYINGSADTGRYGKCAIYNSTGNLKLSSTQSNITRELIKSQIEDLTANYSIDGFCWDYIRYSDNDGCYCDECKSAFQEWLGEGNITDWSPFYPNGLREAEYKEWRTIPITILVRDMREWALAVNPDLCFGAAVFTHYFTVGSDEETVLFTVLISENGENGSYTPFITPIAVGIGVSLTAASAVYIYIRRRRRH